MTDLARVVWKTLDENPCIRMNMGLGLINTRALARYLIKEKNIKGSIDAVINTLRRYKIDTSGKIFGNALKIISKPTTISTKVSLANIALIKDTEIQELLPKLFSFINYDRGDVLRIIQANGSINILIDEKKLEEIKNIFPEGKIINVHKNLAEINVHMHPDAKNTPGIIAVTANELAINGINVIEAMSSSLEMLWFVEEKDLIDAYDALNRLWQLKPVPLKKN